jgi:uncharacterized membrane protein (DUF2068 family)
MRQRAARAEPSNDYALWLIGAVKLIKGLLLVVVAIGALRLLHNDAATVVAAWAAHVHIDPDNRYVARVIRTVSSLDNHKLNVISAGMFCYAALLLTEGTGLLLRCHWAEYFTVIVTGSFLPLELYELVRRLTIPRMVVVALNGAIVWYLARRLAASRHSKALRSKCRMRYRK